MAKRKPLAPFRVPKGVPTEIRKALRLGTPGRFLSTVKALQLHDLLTLQDRQARQAHRKAASAFERARRPETRQKHLTTLRAIQRTAGGIQHGLSQLSEGFGFEPLPPLPSPDVVPVAPREEEPSEDYALEEEGALEAEVGVDYTESDGWRHKATSDVSFNARLFRRDGRPLTESDVRSALQDFAESGRMPRGIEVKTVSWQNYKGQVSTGGDVNDLDNFRAILQRVGDSGLRIGLVKPDAL